MTRREEILQRFESHLDAALQTEDTPQGIPTAILQSEDDSAATDWHAIWSAMTALTQEVKLQGRSFKQMSDSLQADAERRGRREGIDGLLDLRERLLRGLSGVGESVEPLAPNWLDRLFPGRLRELERERRVAQALTEGYRLTLSSLDDLLQNFQIHPIECRGLPFDPKRMNAVDVEETTGATDGTVVEVYRSGYEWNGELYRPAQVRVARRLVNGDPK